MFCWWDLAGKFRENPRTHRKPWRAAAVRAGTAVSIAVASRGAPAPSPPGAGAGAAPLRHPRCAEPQLQNPLGFGGLGSAFFPSGNPNHFWGFCFVFWGVDPPSLPTHLRSPSRAASLEGVAEGMLPGRFSPFPPLCQIWKFVLNSSSLARMVTTGIPREKESKYLI